MPFAVEPKAREATSSRACQAIVATRIIQPGFEWRVLRNLQLLQFNTPLLLDDDDQLRAALSSVGGLELDPVMAALDSPRFRALSARTGRRRATPKAAPPRSRTRPCEPTERSATAPRRSSSRATGARSRPVAWTGPGLRRDRRQPRSGPDRARPAEEPLDALALYPGGLTTQEVAAVTSDCDVVRPDRD